MHTRPAKMKRKNKIWLVYMLTVHGIYVVRYTSIVLLFNHFFHYHPRFHQKSRKFEFSFSVCMLQKEKVYFKNDNVVYENSKYGCSLFSSLLYSIKSTLNRHYTERGPFGHFPNFKRPPSFFFFSFLIQMTNWRRK